MRMGQNGTICVGGGVRKEKRSVNENGSGMPANGVSLLYYKTNCNYNVLTVIKVGIIINI